MNRNHPALWALIGVVVGMGMPALACIGLGIALSLTAGSLLRSTPAPVDTAIHVSGPPQGPAIAMIDVEGPIVSGETSPFATVGAVAAAGDLVPLIQQAGENRDVKVLMVRVNTPGGSVVPSDQIYHALRATGKPVVVLMGDLAASGGYYLSMAASYIVANPNTLTGSIGVISQFPDAHEFLEEIGVRVTIIQSGEAKDMASPFRPMSEEEKAIWQEIVNESYQRFVAIVAEGREIPVETVRNLADGRVFTGGQALELGLVDELGYEEDALDRAAQLGEIEGEPRVIRYERDSPLRSLLGGSVTTLKLPFDGLPLDWFQHLLAPSLEYRWLP